jgi:hypothetical protein
VADSDIVFEHILPSGHGIRFVKADTRRMLEITQRAAESLPAPVPGQPHSDVRLRIEVQKETLATCLRGLTFRPVTPVFKEAPPAVEGQLSPPPQVDLEATLAQYRDPAKNAWRMVGYSELIKDGPTNLLSLLSEMRDFNGALARISAADGGVQLEDPFAGLPSTRMG